MSDDVPMRLLSSSDVDALATSPVGLAAAADSARLAGTKGLTTGRVQVNGDVSWMRIMAGLVDDLDILGYKEFHRVGQRVRYHVHLFRQSTGDALGTVDGRRITGLRTASTAAVAARHWAGDRPLRLGLIGSGEEAREGIRALSGAVTLTGASVWSPTQANREGFAEEMTSETATRVEPCASMAEVMESCDIVYVATSSHHEPFLDVDQIGQAGLVAAIGSTMPVHRELRGSVFVGAAQVVVDTPDATHESGDCLDAVALGWDAGDAVLLGAYLNQQPVPAGDGYTLFKSIGSVEQDLVLAYHLLMEAERRDMGEVINDVSSLRLMR